MKKRIIAAFLTICFVLGSYSSAFALNVEASSAINALHEETIKAHTGEYAETINRKTLYDLSGNKFDLIETGNKGYYIFDSISGKYLEEAPEAPSPYLGLSSNLYYFGPMCYYQKRGNIFDHTVLPTEYNLSANNLSETQNNFGAGLERVREEKNEAVLTLLEQDVSNLQAVNTATVQSQIIEDYYIVFYEYIRYATYPKNVNSTCGYTAACLVLNYWNKIFGGVIPDDFLDSNGNLLIDRDVDGDGTIDEYVYDLQDKLLSYGDSNLSWGASIKDVLRAYCDDYGINASISWTLLTAGAYTDLENGDPIILFGSLADPSVSGSSYLNHAVTAYGLSYRVGDNNRFIVHYGWSGYERVYLEGNLIANTTRFKLVWN